MKLVNKRSRDSFSQIETRYEFDEMYHPFDVLSNLVQIYNTSNIIIKKIRAIEVGDYDEPHLNIVYDPEKINQLIETFKDIKISEFEIDSDYEAKPIYTSIEPREGEITIRYSPEIQDYINTVMNSYIDYYKKKENEKEELQNMFKEEKEDTKGHSFEPGNPLKK